ncbi:hypothetical protein VPH1254_0048 [Vibrio phage 1254]
MKKTREKWNGFCDRLEHLECWQGRTELNSVKIGEGIRFVQQKGCSFSLKNGTLFAIGNKSFIVVSAGELVKVGITVDE